MSDNDDSLSAYGDGQVGTDRSVKACDACHRAKSRCGGDGVNSCPSCNRKGIDCVYSAAKKRGPKSGALADLKAEVAALRAQLVAHNDALAGGHGGHGGGGSGATGAKRRRVGTADSAAAVAAAATSLPSPAMSSSASSSSIADRYVPINEELPLAPHENLVNYIRLYYTRQNPLLPMLCKELFYFCGMRLQLWDLMASVCENARPVCNHAAGDCAKMAFAVIMMPDGTPLSNAPTAPSVKRATALVNSSSSSSSSGSSSSSSSGGGGGGGVMRSGPAAVPPTGYMRAWPALIAAHMAQLPAHVRAPQANTPTVLSACKACFYGVLAIGARLAMHFEVADGYAARARSALAAAFDEPCQETISGALLLAFYITGTAADGDTLRAKCYMSLANEMADGLELTPAAIRRRSVSNAFSADRPSSTTPTPTAAAAAVAAAASSSSSSHSYSHHSHGHGHGDGSSSSSHSTPVSSPLAAAASALAPPDVPTGVPLDILLSVRFLAQMISAYRSGPDGHGMDRRRGEEWQTPRGRVNRILAFVTERTRRKISTPESLRVHAPELLRALDDAEAINAEHKLGGSVDFATRAAIHTSRAVVMHACGDAVQAQHYAAQALAAMDTPLRVYASFMTAAVFVQLVPVLLAGKKQEGVAQLVSYLQEVAAMWPVGHVLVAKAHRRIQYMEQQQQHAHRARLAEAAAGRGIPTAAFRQLQPGRSSGSGGGAITLTAPQALIVSGTGSRAPGSISSAAWPPPLAGGANTINIGATATAGIMHSSSGGDNSSGSSSMLGSPGTGTGSRRVSSGNGNGNGSGTGNTARLSMSLEAAAAAFPGASSLVSAMGGMQPPPPLSSVGRSVSSGTGAGTGAAGGSGSGSGSGEGRAGGGAETPLQRLAAVTSAFGEPIEAVPEEEDELLPRLHVDMPMSRSNDSLNMWVGGHGGAGAGGAGGGSASLTPELLATTSAAAAAAAAEGSTNTFGAMFGFLDTVWGDI